ncbi:hypothetical protein CRE_21999 [Caenorhabditis remanei]|uniref:F-box domain-containing protein n=1 Tax=Caenorhabditis remanei TaxID=31234 RepID=E3N3K1_CAERE|nr:hypothetical protein CRE_21999 [Caenorhabditis remanei]
MPPFLLLHLPQLVLFKVFKSLSINEKIKLSICSKRISTQINNARLYSQKVVVVLDILRKKISVFSKNGQDKCEIFTYPDSGKSQDSNAQQFSIACCSVSAVSIPIGIKIFCKNHEEGFLSVIRHLLEMFRCKISTGQYCWRQELFQPILTELFDLQQEFGTINVGLHEKKSLNSSSVWFICTKWVCADGSSSGNPRVYVFITTMLVSSCFDGFGPWVFTILLPYMNNDYYQIRIPPTMFAPSIESASNRSARVFFRPELYFRSRDRDHPKHNARSDCGGWASILPGRYPTPPYRPNGEHRNDTLPQDETWVYLGMVLKRAWQFSSSTMYQRARLLNPEAPVPGPKKGASRGKRGIVAAVITEEGVLKGSEQVWVSSGKLEDQTADYHSEMNSDLYEEYIKTRVLPELIKTAASANRPPVLVIDNAPYHNRYIDKAPTKSCRKDVIIDWLSTRGVSTPKKAKKPQVVKMLENYINSKGGRDVFKRYVVDEYAKSLGVTVIRLPPYHCFLNPIELMWSQLKHEVMKAGTTSTQLAEVRQNTLQFLQNFSAESSMKLFQHVSQIEEEVRIKIKERASSTTTPSTP